MRLEAVTESDGTLAHYITASVLGKGLRQGSWRSSIRET